MKIDANRKIVVDKQSCQSSRKCP